MKNGCDAVDVADVFQEAMMVLFGKAQDEEFRLTCNVGTYLMAISKNLWYKKLQSLSKAPVSLDEDKGNDEGRTDIRYEDDVNVHYEREAHYEQLNVALDQVGERLHVFAKSLLSS